MTEFLEHLNVCDGKNIKPVIFVASQMVLWQNMINTETDKKAGFLSGGAVQSVWDMPLVPNSPGKERVIGLKCFKRISCVVLMVLLMLGMVLPACAQETAVHETTILFTHDLHSHFLPQETEGGGQSGGYARLATVIGREKRRSPNALLLDAGDFSIGSLIQTLYTTRAAELRTMGAMGYVATTAGNHEFDHEGTGFARMLQAAYTSGEALPALLMANYKPADDNPDQLDIQRAMASYGVKETMLVESDGVTIGLFGLMGQDSHDCAPSSGFTLEDPIQAARRCVKRLKEQGAEFIICLSHSGTDEKAKKSEDEQLAKKVDGIDVIVSGHTHTTLDQPIVVGDTYIVSAGEYCQNLGSLTLRWSAAGEKELVDYRLIPIDQTVPEDAEIAALVEQWKGQVEGDYLGRYGLDYDQVLTHTTFDLNTPVSGVQTGNALGELVADSFLWAVEHLEAEAPDVPTVAVTADGVLRADLAAGALTTSMAFDVLSMGVGSDGTSGFPLVGVFLTGKELKAAMEVDASVTPIMPAAQLYLSGAAYAFNPHRMFFNRVTDSALCAPAFRSGETGAEQSEIQDDQLYRVVTGMYSAQMLGTVKSKSFGLLSLEPKMADGSPVTDFEACIIRDKSGNEVKEWYALASYLGSFGADGVPGHYAAPDGRKNVSHSMNPIALVQHPNWITLAAVLVLLVAAALVCAVVRIALHRLRGRRYGGRSGRYRG